MSAWTYADLRVHIGHRIECVGYGDGPSSNPQSVSVECVDCCVVILAYDRNQD